MVYDSFLCFLPENMSLILRYIFTPVMIPSYAAIPVLKWCIIRSILLFVSGGEKRFCVSSCILSFDFLSSAFFLLFLSEIICMLYLVISFMTCHYLGLFSSLSLSSRNNLARKFTIGWKIIFWRSMYMTIPSNRMHPPIMA